MLILLAAFIWTVGFVMAGPGSARAENQLRCSAWAVYWNTEAALEEAELLADRLQGISLFAAYFNTDRELFVPYELVELQLQLQSLEHPVPLVLTIVNDRLRKEDSPVLKDRELLKQLFSNCDSRHAHAEEIIALAKSLQVAGIELDYENLGKDKNLWRDYASFIDVMIEKTREAGLTLSVILEPSGVDKADFPEGPQYVVMLYNLYGYHSGPGPKADIPFVRSLASRMMKLLPGKPAAAFSAGGFDWQSNGKTTALTEKQAISLAESLGVTAKRDERSGVLYFHGHEDGLFHEVWFADGQTIQLWMETARALGVSSYYFWLLGGNEPESLMALLD